MPSIDQFYQPGGIDMGVDLGGGDIGMAQQSLQHPQVCPAFQQMGGKGMPQDMRADLCGIQSCMRSQILNYLEQANAADMPFA